MKVIKKHPYIIYVIFFVILFILHMQLHQCGDDIWFSAYKISDLPSFLSMRYATWSSRLLIEFLLVISVNLPHIIWAIIDSLVLLIIARSLSYLYTKDRLEDQILAILFTSIFPLQILKTAGWYATTINYLWTLGCAVLAVYPIKKILNQEKIKPYQYPIYVITLLFACNQEQCCALLFGFYLLFSIYFMTRDKKIDIQKKWFIYLQLLFTILSFIFIMTCPGNSSRVLSEMQTHYPAYANFNLIHKGMLGINYSLSGLLFSSNLVFLIFSIFLVIRLKNHKSTIIKTISFIPLVLILFKEFLHEIMGHFIPSLNAIYDYMYHFSDSIQTIKLLSKENLFVLAISLIMILSIVISLYEIMKSVTKKRELHLFVPILYMAGILSIIMMGFSPSIYASSTRIFTYFNFFLISIMLIVDRYQKTSKQELIIITLFAMLNLINLIVLP